MYDAGAVRTSRYALSFSLCNLRHHSLLHKGQQRNCVPNWTILIAHQEMNANVLHAQLAPVFQEAIDFKRLRRLKREIGGAP